jgi:hypothetical protein
LRFAGARRFAGVLRFAAVEPLRFAGLLRFAAAEPLRSPEVLRFVAVDPLRFAGVLPLRFAGVLPLRFAGELRFAEAPRVAEVPRFAGAVPVVPFDPAAGFERGGIEPFPLEPLLCVLDDVVRSAIAASVWTVPSARTRIRAAARQLPYRKTV